MDGTVLDGQDAFQTGQEGFENVSAINLCFMYFLFHFIFTFKLRPFRLFMETFLKTCKLCVIEEGLKCSLVLDHPILLNPVALVVDNKNRLKEVDMKSGKKFKRYAPLEDGDSENEGFVFDMENELDRDNEEEENAVGGDDLPLEPRKTKKHVRFAFLSYNDDGEEQDDSLLVEPGDKQPFPESDETESDETESDKEEEIDGEEEKTAVALPLVASMVKPKDGLEPVKRKAEEKTLNVPLVVQHRDEPSTSQPMRFLFTDFDKTCPTCDTTRCFLCGQYHITLRCPARGKVCSKCGNLNHYSYRCDAVTGAKAKE